MPIGLGRNVERVGKRPFLALPPRRADELLAASRPRLMKTKSTHNG